MFNTSINFSSVQLMDHVLVELQFYSIIGALSFSNLPLKLTPLRKNEFAEKLVLRKKYFFKISDVFQVNKDQLPCVENGIVESSAFNEFAIKFNFTFYMKIHFGSWMQWQRCV